MTKDASSNIQNSGMSCDNGGDIDGWTRRAKKPANATLMAACSELLRQFEGNGSSQAKSGQQIRPLRLNGSYIAGKYRGDFFNGWPRFLAGFQAWSLQCKQGLIGAQMTRHIDVAKHIAVVTRHSKQRPPAAQWLDRDNGGRADSAAHSRLTVGKQ